MQKIDLAGIKNIVFDLGGVIIDLDYNEALRRFREAGVEDAEKWVNPYHQNGIFLDLEAGKLSRDEFCDALREATGKPISNEAIDAGWMGFLKEAPENKLRLLENLRERGYRVYALSNTNPVAMKWAFSSDFSPEGKPIDAYFDKLYLSYQMKCVKPEPVIFRKMIADSGMIPSETLYLDDGLANVQTAEQLGFKTYQPLNGEDFCPLFS